MTCSLKLFIIFVCFVFFLFFLFVSYLYKCLITKMLLLFIVYICMYITKKLFISKLKVEFLVEIN
jgi:hypothetical protein